MSRTILTILLAVCHLLRVAGASEPRGSAVDVVVEAIDLPGHEAGESENDYLWRVFASRPEVKLFSGFSTKEWRTRYEQFSSALVSKAEGKGLDADSLRAILAHHESTDPYRNGIEIAYLPISAFWCKSEDGDLWIVTCLWEDAEPIKEHFVPSSEPGASGTNVKLPEPIWSTLGHIRIFGYAIPSRECVWFTTCL